MPYIQDLALQTQREAELRAAAQRALAKAGETRRFLDGPTRMAALNQRQDLVAREAAQAVAILEWMVLHGGDIRGTDRRVLTPDLTHVPIMRSELAFVRSCSRDIRAYNLAIPGVGVAA